MLIKLYYDGQWNLSDYPFMIAAEDREQAIAKMEHLVQEELTNLEIPVDLVKGLKGPFDMGNIKGLFQHSQEEYKKLKRLEREALLIPYIVNDRH